MCAGYLPVQTTGERGKAMDTVAKADSRVRRRKVSKQHAVPAETRHLMRRSMHDGVPVWCDCCSCEAEPYWSERSGGGNGEESTDR